MIGVSAWEIVLLQKFTDFHFNQFEQLLVVDHVDFVQKYNERGHTNLTRKQNVLTGLRHGAVSGRHHQNGAVHLSGTRDHVLHIVSVAWAIDVRIVAVVSFILNVCR